MIPDPIAKPLTPNSAKKPDLEGLRAAAEALETQFLSEMLKGAGLEAREGAFSGGAGEDQFASMLRERQAESMVAAGGIGLAEQIFSALERSARAE
ncbi:rod binding protein [Palleronia aestuarii]|uniref:Rod binding protein n=1 Tax=Palleronia aestuarii TaxID=568105 RepID=A0A2W7PZV9_9RHOB|nr:rod-binding protein [Palleronia aestuarii]PZX15059.1 rod binding protein [Palleronia aestuarii]